VNQVFRSKYTTSVDQQHINQQETMSAQHQYDIQAVFRNYLNIAADGMVHYNNL